MEKTKIGFCFLYFVYLGTKIDFTIFLLPIFMTEFVEKLEELRASLVTMPADIGEADQAFYGQLLESDIKAHALRTGSKIPDFELPNVFGKMISIHDLYKNNLIVIKFYRGQWCPFCSLELQHLQKNLQKIENCPAKVVAISPQTPDNSLETVQKNKLSFEVLSDLDSKVGKLFRLVYEIPEHLNQLYKKYGVDFQFFNGQGKIQLPMPATYVVDRQGIIVFDDIPVFADQRQDPQSLVNFLQTNFRNNQK